MKGPKTSLGTERRQGTLEGSHCADQSDGLEKKETGIEIQRKEHSNRKVDMSLLCSLMPNLPTN